jgi:hypothetical protein
MYGRHEEAPVATAPISGTNASPVRGRSTRQRAAVAAALDEVPRSCTTYSSTVVTRSG